MEKKIPRWEAILLLLLLLLFFLAIEEHRLAHNLRRRKDVSLLVMEGTFLFWFLDKIKIECGITDIIWIERTIDPRGSPFLFRARRVECHENSVKKEKENPVNPPTASTLRNSFNLCQRKRQHAAKATAKAVATTTATATTATTATTTTLTKEWN